jgi:hypothetical protein
VDSQGQVYILSNSATSGSAQVVRQLGVNGILTFSTSQLRGTATAAKTEVITNTGNSALNVTGAVFTGNNPGDYALDPTTTSCNFSSGNSLASGQSCKVGVIFKPSAAGTRTASLTLLDNTVTNANTILLTGAGVLPSPTVKITAPASGASFSSGTTVKFSVSVTSSGTAPTGNVTFKVDGAAYGSPVTLASGAAAVSLTGLTVKAHTISATYNGDGNYSAVTVSETITVTAAAVKAPRIRSGTELHSGGLVAERSR